MARNFTLRFLFCIMRKASSVLTLHVASLPDTFPFNIDFKNCPTRGFNNILLAITEADFLFFVSNPAANIALVPLPLNSIYFSQKIFSIGAIVYSLLPSPKSLP